MSSVQQRVVPLQTRSKNTPGRKGKLVHSRIRWGLLFVSPWLIGLLTLVLVPMLLSLYYSFTDYNIIGAPRWVGWDNYRALLDDPTFWSSSYNTLYLVVFMVPSSLVVGLVYALLLNQPIRGRKLFRTVLYMPQLVPPVATSMLWIWILNPSFGLINKFLGIFHITGPLWLASMEWSKPSLILIHWWSIGGTMLIFLAGLQGVSPALLEAAYLDGAGAWQRFRHVTLPAISPLMLFNLIMGVLGAMQYFTQAYIMGGGGSDGGSVGVGGSLEFYSIYLYQLAFVNLRMGYASALAWVLFLILAVLIGLLLAWSKKWTHYEGMKTWK
ncbi:sugar ABC transporter permease [Paenibacillus filicis]|uniref:Sugar ABC transporter permease n=1 Tax=Paenibacillus gyeongsangnamensis TaxID=3388067 RepID=A0ABT4QH94_9BACL|nr:sugar ABC transporter permease [Paenibacillus filicis]MCZ8516259.1 sugar ABC transporter permease [Paenibacillus filicis]